MWHLPIRLVEDVETATEPEAAEHRYAGFPESHIVLAAQASATETAKPLCCLPSGVSMGPWRRPDMGCARRHSGVALGTEGCFAAGLGRCCSCRTWMGR